MAAGYPGLSDDGEAGGGEAGGGELVSNVEEMVSRTICRTLGGRKSPATDLIESTGSWRAPCTSCWKLSDR